MNSCTNIYLWRALYLTKYDSG